MSGHLGALSKCAFALQAVSQQPVSVVVYCDLAFQLYAGGVFDKKYNESILFMNHAVLVVGYNKTQGKEYWTVKNSWGEHKAVSSVHHV